MSKGKVSKAKTIMKLNDLSLSWKRKRICKIKRSRSVGIDIRFHAQKIL